MKKWFCLGMILAILIGIGIARADDIDTQIVLKETQFQALQWQFRYLQSMIDRAKIAQEGVPSIQKEMDSLLPQGQRLQMEIDVLKKQREEKQKIK